jgi:NAD(P)-dependent dehydrogenase (short-subunit alcohol dehydrogenase family)
MNPKTIVITGAAGVLGNLVAKTFAERGYNLALLGRDQSKLDAFVRDLNLPEDRIHASAVDLLDDANLAGAAKSISAKFGNIHALIHLVGGWTGGKTIPESSKDDFAFMLAQHAWTTYQLLKVFTPYLIKNDSSRVIVVSHPVTVKPSAKSALYAAAKSAQESLVLTLAEEFKDQGLTANIIQVKSIDADKGTSPAEIVAAMTYLFSEEAGKISAARIPLY